ncbi:MAG: NAD+ synthase [Desulfobacteraceae bacterium]|nr:NAD+ synthase [Desulfobacteraceae bacterium]
MKIAICQINPVIGDIEYNASLIKDATEKAKKARCELAVFPEMSLVGYPARDLLEKSAFVSKNLDQLERLSSEIWGISILCGYAERNPFNTGKPCINGVALIRDGQIISKGGKRLLPTYDVFDETRYFEPSRESMIFELEGKRGGVTLCEDIWSGAGFSGVPQYDVDPVSELANSGIDVLINLSASPYSVNKETHRLDLLKRLSKAYDIPVIFCNQVGGNDELLFDGLSMVVDQSESLIRLGKQFEPDIVIWDTDKTYEEIRDPWPPEEKTILKGLTMGTRDYILKCGFSKAHLGLSGGLDSALVAFIAREAVGASNVTGISMPSPYTSDLSRECARQLSENLGIRFEEISINDLFDNYKRALAPLFKDLQEGETEENIQARIRGNLLMALSNKFDSLLLSTGNKSELAIGYCTLYGDMSGGLAVISDVPKTLCYRLANYINKNGEIIPHEIISRPPSAELKPNQKDQDVLPPYDILDDILEAAVEENLGVEEIVARGHDSGVVKDVMRRLAFNEYKRRQAPTGLKITTKAFGYGRVYPIARGKQVY